jgi:imidazolonepropionase-like amidohydrolase/Tol biopolymer transport system component
MDADGRNARQVSREKERQVSNPAWTPDGMYLVGRKHFRNTRSLGAGEMWMYHLAGGAGSQISERRNWEQNATEPIVSPDGRYLYYSEDVSPGGGFQYNRDPHGVIYVVQRIDLRSGEKETWLDAPGGSLAPRLSPDGSRMAFVRRVGTRSALMVHEMASGRERMLWDGLSHDQQEAWAIFGTYPGYAWTPDGSSIVVWAQGKLWRVDAATGAQTLIPFTARVRHRLTDAVRFTQEVAPESFDVRMLRWVSVSPDERHVVYGALGKLWIRELPDGTPRRLTGDQERWELYPAWSPDGRTLVYTSWSDSEQGAVRTVSVTGMDGRVLTPEPGHYVEPAFSADGGRVVYRKIGGDDMRGELYTHDRGIYLVPAEGGAPARVTDEGSRPRFNRTGDRIYLMGQEEERTTLESVDLSGGDRRVHLSAEAASEIVPSPDDRYVAVVERFNAYVAPLPHTGRAIQFAPGTSDYPVKRVSRDAGSYLHWTPDSRRLYWTLGPELFRQELGETFAFEALDTTRVLREPRAAGRAIGFSAPHDCPAGRVALVGGTVITMGPEGVIPNATVLVEGNRITAVGPTAAMQVPADAAQVDVTGRYLMPGIVDVHAHVGVGSAGISPQTNWELLVNLAYGVTTLHDPSNDTEAVFTSSELLKAGLMTGPRLFSTGRILYGADTDYKVVVGSYEEALSHLRRLRSVGAFTVKSYNQPRRDARQQIVEAARELEMMVVPEGGSTFYFNMSQVLDGHTGVEHNIPIAPLYRDVLTLIAESEVGYTPTLIVNYGGLSGEYYWYQESDVWAKEPLRHFTPHGVLDARSRRRPMAADEDYSYVETAKAAKAILDAGGRVQLGAHGQLQGLGAHWELWMLAQGGMTPMEALRTATLSGAEYLGLDDDLGSIEAGKLADLVVLGRDPLADIRNSESVEQVMVNGRLYDAATLAQLGNHPTPAPEPFWQEN